MYEYNRIVILPLVKIKNGKVRCFKTAENKKSFTGAMLCKFPVFVALPDCIKPFIYAVPDCYKCLVSLTLNSSSKTCKKTN